VRSFGAALATKRTVEDVEAWPERIGAVTAAQVNAAAAYVFRPEQSVTGRLVPAPQQTAAAAPLRTAPAEAATGEREINAGQDSDG
jgi:zinc protease